MRIRTLSLVTALVLGIALTPAVSRSEPSGPGRTSASSANVAAMVREEADWILTTQLGDGAIAHHTDKAAVWPYLSNFASVGLARATEVTGDSRYVAAAWRWLDWYQAHQSPEGFVTDYQVRSDGTVVSTGEMDSTDAYAGTFLWAAWSVYETSRDRTALKRLRPGIEGAVRAIEATVDVDGLTWAKPTWRVKYLMDQAEVYVGLSAASRLRSALGDKAGAKQASAKAASLKSSVTALWNPAQQAYDWAVHESGAHDATTWSVLYPDALQQMWAVAFGLTDAARSEQLVTVFAQLHPYWDEPASTWSVYGQERTVGYWPVAGWSLLRAGKTSEAAEAAGSIRSAAIGTGRAWPYTPGNAGQLIVLLTGGSDPPAS